MGWLLLLLKWRCLFHVWHTAMLSSRYHHAHPATSLVWPADLHCLSQHCLVFVVYVDCHGLWEDQATRWWCCWWLRPQTPCHCWTAEFLVVQTYRTAWSTSQQLLQHIWYQRKSPGKFTEVVASVKDSFVVSIWLAAHVYQVNLHSCQKAKGDDRFGCLYLFHWHPDTAIWTGLKEEPTASLRIHA